jgi:hypothetical protein
VVASLTLGAVSAENFNGVFLPGHRGQGTQVARVGFSGRRVGGEVAADRHGSLAVTGIDVHQLSADVWKFVRGQELAGGRCSCQAVGSAR